MSNSDEETDSDDSTDLTSIQLVVDDIDGFLENNTHLFVLIGVFSAAGIYIRDLSLPETGPNTISFDSVALFSSFGIVFFLLITAIVKAYLRVRESDHRWSDVQNYPYIILFILLLPLIGTVYSYLTTLSLPALLFTFGSSYILMPFLVLSLYKRIEAEEFHKKIAGRVPASPQLISLIGQVSVLTAGLQAFNWMNTTYDPNQFVIQSQNLDLAWILFPFYFIIWVDILLIVIISAKLVVGIWLSIIDMKRILSESFSKE